MVATGFICGARPARLPMTLPSFVRLATSMVTGFDDLLIGMPYTGSRGQLGGIGASYVMFGKASGFARLFRPRLV